MIDITAYNINRLLDDKITISSDPVNLRKLYHAFDEQSLGPPQSG